MNSVHVITFSTSSLYDEGVAKKCGPHQEKFNISGLNPFPVVP